MSDYVEQADVIRKTVLTGITTNQDAVVAASPDLRLVGYAVRENASAAATVDVIDGATATGGVLAAPTNLAADESQTHFLGQAGIPVKGGISVIVSGGADLVLYHKKVDG